MYATIKKQNESTIAEFNRTIPHPIESVWRILTVNEQLQKWFPELEIEQLQPDGKIRFDFGNGSYEEMIILEVSEPTNFAFSWDKNTMRFELAAIDDKQTALKVSEDIAEVTSHTPRDIAGWQLAWITSLILDGSS